MMRITLYRDHPAEGWYSMARYAENLHSAMQQNLPARWIVNMPMPPLSWSNPYGQILVRTFGYPLWANRQQGDLNHIVDHSYGHLLFALDPARTLVTVHDASPLHFPGFRLGISGLAWRLAWQGVRRAQHIITDSSFIAAELRHLLDLPPERLHVVQQAVSPQFCPQPAEATKAIRERYLPEGGWMLLHVGHAQKRKNLPTLLHALAQIRRQGIPAMLVQVGSQPTPTLSGLIHNLELKEAVHFVGRVSDNELIGLYSAADLFVFPSLYEGFGFPILEAMACGTPVIASDAASLPEVVGEAGVLADPHSPEAFADAIASLLLDSAQAAEYRRRGLARARQFTWEQTAQRTLAVYRSIAGEMNRRSP